MRKQQGNAVIGLVFFMVFAILFILPEISGIMVEKKMQNEFPEVSLEDRKLVDDFKEKDEPEKYLEGVYQTVYKEDKMTLEAKFYFTKDRAIVKELIAKGEDDEVEVELTGEAKYSFEGSTIQYEYVSGAKGIFSQIGDAITIVDDNNFIFHEPEVNFHFTKT